MSRIQQDQFVEDEEDELCPLCVEEFDLSDKNFRPCPCGYQICQFCYNNIKTTLNGLCPACRRPYDDSNIQFRRITPEEMAKHKQQIAQKAKKNAALRQKEAQKAEADSLSRKHLAGLRVVQKNLVYVTGLTPTIREDRLLDTLRGNDYFGQYGKIIKIVVSKARENAQHQQSVGVYVTFARKEDAAACIAAVDGSHNGDRTLRAQYGTTKYCSAYLRGEQCNNRNCMFLHEPGEENDSFTRQDLSMMNSIQTQQPNQSPANAAPPPHRGPAVAAAAAPMHRQESSDTHSPTGDAPGLPATASWGSKAAQERRASRSTIASNSSPMVTNAVPAQVPKAPVKAEEASKKKEKDKDKEKEKENEKGREKEKGKDKEKEKEKTAQTVAASQSQSQPAARPSQAPMPDFVELLKALPKASFQFVFSSASLSDEDLRTITSYPPLMEPDGGAKRRALREKQRELEAQQVQRETELKAAIPDTGAEQNEDNGEATAGGSLQLGGEPEERHEAGSGQGNRSAIAPPGQNPMSAGIYGPNVSLTDDFANLGLSSRGLTPQQQQQLLLSTMKSGSPQPPGLQSIFPQQQTHGQMGNTPGHARHASRFSFANDTSSASASVQPVANQKLMSQQSSMMPKNTGHFNQISQHQPMGTQFYTSGVQGPPPGLKATGTPPVSGGGMFGQGHGFTTSGLGYGATAGARNANDMMYQDLLRGRNMEGGARVDTGKRESMFPSFLNQHPTTSTPASTPGLLTFPYGPSPGAYQESGSQKSKKKGKKHRHANTSSSGGGGLVDVQDPSILQARLHQGGGMAGQGLYPGQGQDEPLFSPEEQATANVDALVNDDIQLVGRDISVVPPIYEQHRRATPTIPPGFSAPIAHRALTEYSTPPMSRTASSDITPAVPLVPITPVKMPSSQRPRRQGEVVSTPGAPASAANTRPSSLVKRSEKSSSGKSQTMPEVRTAETVEPTTQLEESKTKPVVTESPSKPTTKSKSGNKKGKDVPAAEATPSKAVKDNTLATLSKEIKDNTPVPTLQKDAKNLAPPATPVSTSKRQHPGKLDLAVATELLEPSQKHVSSPLKTDTPSKAGRTVSVPLTASSPVPASPAATSTGSPIKRAAAPRTIRVVPTPRTETPPALPAVSIGPPHVPTVDKLRSRQASIASINQPGTPASEMISEDASIITSASVSRASSPPLIGGKVGSAPVRKKTKSQAKKERQERARQMLEEQTLALEEQAKAEPEPEHAPIVGRKTKKRKSTANAPKAPAGPAKTQTTSLKDGPTEESEESEPKHPPAPVAGVKKEVDALPLQPSIEKAPSSPPLETGPKEKANMSAQAIIADLQKSGELLASTLEFFKPLSSSLAHAVRTAPQSGAPTAPQDAKLHFTQADLEALAKKQPVRLSGPDGKPDSRYLISPQGKFLWGLTKELEDKALELEKHIEELKGPARFHPQQHTPHVPSAAPHAQSGDVLPAIATALKEAGAKLKSGSAAAAVQSMPKIDPNVQNSHQAPAPQQQAPVDAGAYLNQFVLPGTDNPTPNTSRTDTCGVGGPPGAGAGNTSVNIGKIAKAAKVVAEGGTLSNELEGMGVMAADLLGGVVVQGLEWLMNAGLGTNIHQDLSVDGKGNITLGGNGFDVQGLVDAMGSAGGLAGVEAAQGRRGRRSVLSVNEAEQAMLAAKKEYESLEKKLAALMKRNRKLVGATK